MKAHSLVALTVLILSTSRGATAQNNPVLDSLARADQDARNGRSPDGSDEQRLHRVLHQLATNGMQTSDDRVNAAIVLVHSPLTVRQGKLVAINPDHFLLAHFLAKAAFDSGNVRARYLVAQTIDRYLAFTSGVQRYGTNRTNDLETGVEGLVPIDRQTTDAERAEYGVPPLKELLKLYREWPRP
jgi:hypothetical protein